MSTNCFRNRTVFLNCTTFNTKSFFLFLLSRPSFLLLLKKKFKKKPIVYLSGEGGGAKILTFPFFASLSLYLSHTFHYPKAPDRMSSKLSQRFVHTIDFFNLPNITNFKKHHNLNIFSSMFSSWDSLINSYRMLAVSSSYRFFQLTSEKLTQKHLPSIQKKTNCFCQREERLVFLSIKTFLLFFGPYRTLFFKWSPLY